MEIVSDKLEKQPDTKVKEGFSEGNLSMELVEKLNDVENFTMSEGQLRREIHKRGRGKKNKLWSCLFPFFEKLGSCITVVYKCKNKKSYFKNLELCYLMNLRNKYL